MPHILHILSEQQRFVRQYIPMTRAMYSMAYRLLQHEQEAEDVVQDVLLSMYEQRHTLPPEASELPYVLSVVRNRSIDLLRARPYETIAPPGDSGTEPTTDSLEAQLEARDELEHLLASIPGRAGEIVRMRIVGDLSFEEIARRTGMTAGNARVIVSRALKDIKNNHTPS